MYFHEYKEQRCSYDEICNFWWETLQEWTLVPNKHLQLYTHQERVFWYVFYQTQYVTEDALLKDSLESLEIENCLHYLETNKACPLDVVGYRP